MWEVRGGGSLPFIVLCLFLRGVLECLKTDTLIGHCILLEKAMNMKIRRVIR